MDWLFTNLGSVIDERKLMTSSNDPAAPKPIDLLQILLDAEVGRGSSRGSSVSHLIMCDKEEDYNSNYELDTAFTPENSSQSKVNYLKTKLEEVFHQQQSEERWSCPDGAPCEEPRSRLSLDVSVSLTDISLR